MNCRLFSFILLTWAWGIVLHGQTVEDSVAIVTAKWETSVSPDNIVHKNLHYKYKFTIFIKR